MAAGMAGGAAASGGAILKVRNDTDFYPSTLRRTFADASAGSVLVVFFHAFGFAPVDLQRATEVVREHFPGSDLLLPHIPISTFSMADPDKVAADILARLDAVVAAKEAEGGYARIILIGHSLGAMIARKVWVLAHGATPDGGVDPGAARVWANRIDRIVLLAALNRGWALTSAIEPLKALAWRLGIGYGNICRYLFRRDPIIFAFRRGAPFLTTLRLQCLAALREPSIRQPVTVQLIGTNDDYIAPTDNIDFATGQDFFYIESARASHKGLIGLDQRSGGPESVSDFVLALAGTPEELLARSIPKEDVFDIYSGAVDEHGVSAIQKANAEVQHVVFIIHGIRDRGFWTRRLAQTVKRGFREAGLDCRTVTSTYGYFPIAPFLLPWIRREKAEWLLDQYVTARSLYPRASFSYIGHSNGTYLLAKAVELCPAVHFERAVFAGSVVGGDDYWTALIARRIGETLNYVATGDRVVAVFPNGLGKLRLQDLGGAGHDGFREGEPNVVNFAYVRGGHSAALDQQRWQEMARFIVSGERPAPPVPKGRHDGLTQLLGTYAPWVWGLMLLGIPAAAVLLWLFAGAPVSLNIAGLREAVCALFLIVYLYGVAFVLTRW